MKGRLVVAALLAWALAMPAGASAAFGFESFSVAAEKEGGGAETQAGGHPYALRLDVDLNTAGGVSDGDLRDLSVHLPPSFLITPDTVPKCAATVFATPRVNPFEPGSQSGESCPNSTQIGTIAVNVGGTTRHFGLFNLVSPFGAVSSFGASPFHTPIVFNGRVREGDVGLDLDLKGLPKTLDLQGMELTIWGRQPWAYSHDSERGNCLNEQDPSAYYGELATFTPSFKAGTCSLGPPKYIEDFGLSYFTLPTNPCGTTFGASADATSWEGAKATATTNLPPLTQCHKSISVARVWLRTSEASSPTGLTFELDINDGGGITNPEGMALPAIKRAVLSLPEGLTINPSVAAGLGTCSEAQFARETAGSEPGAGCPSSAKIGNVTVDEPLASDEPMLGSLYVATPYANPFKALLGVYLVVRNARLGLVVKSVGEIEPDARGRLTATFDDLPRLLYERFELVLREGQRAPLLSPTSCGAFGSDMAVSSWAEPSVVRQETNTLFVDRGPGGGSCPTGAALPFTPGLLGGSMNPAPATYTPFYLRMTRTDAEQEITSYSATFPPGLLAKLSGVTVCSDAAIAATSRRTGAEEQVSPSCPASSQIGRTMSGYGVSQTLAWAPGKLYLAGPWHGSPLSVVAINPATIGPFDLGVVAVRTAVKVDTRTAQASIDAAGSDPIPHILEGIPLHVRDIRIYLDRPDFIVNGTSCDPLQVSSTLRGAGANPFAPGDETSATSSQRFQLLGCSALDFKPRLSLRLRGGTRRSSYPSLRATVRPAPGQANIAAASVKLPPSIFLAQEHLRDICTRAQFAAGEGGGAGCPKASVYGNARAWTPLLDEPLEGPVYVRTSSNLVPDLVASLSGHGFTVVLEGRIDSFKGGMRGTFEGLPDAPLSKFVMTLPGGKRGLLAVAEDLCAHRQQARSRWIAQSNATSVQGTKLNVKCKKKKRHPKRGNR